MYIYAITYVLPVEYQKNSFEHVLVHIHMLVAVANEIIHNLWGNNTILCNVHIKFPINHFREGFEISQD